jgi:valyl-tRNA synthetase
MDPLELVDAYGADAMRFTLCALAGPGRDIKLGRQRVEGYRSFGTKIWNAVRFCEMNGIAPVAGFDPASARLPLSRWILDTTNTALAEANAALEGFRFDDYAKACYRFAWNDFCDWFLEFAKPVLNGPDGADKNEVKATAAHVLGVILRMLHPVMPFITEELWHRMGYGVEGSLIRSPWPEAMQVADAAEARAELDWVVRLISEMRTVRSEMNVAPSITVPLLMAGARPESLARAERWSDAIHRMGRASEIRALSGDPPKGVVQAVLDETTLMLPLADVIDFAAERARLAKERTRIEGEVQKVEAKLGSETFVSRAPVEIVEENRERLAAWQAEIARLDAALARIAG